MAVILQSYLYAVYTLKGSDTLYLNLENIAWTRVLDFRCVDSKEAVLYYVKRMKERPERIYIQEIGFAAEKFMQGAYTLSSDGYYIPPK